jgi:periplasmic copper chaperone A
MGTYGHVLIAMAAGLAMAFPSLAQAQTYKAGDLEISQVWSRATPKGSKIAAGYLTITNNGKTADKLVSVSAPSAKQVEVHEMAMKDGVMTMRPIPGGIAIGSGKSIKLTPGGLHMMFMNIAAPLKQGDSFPATLVFEKAGAVEVMFAVQGMGARGPSAPHHHGH